jgi:hypothetical protein
MKKNVKHVKNGSSKKEKLREKVAKCEYKN